MVRVSTQTGVLTEKCQEEALFHPLQVNSKSPVGRDTAKKKKTKKNKPKNQNWKEASAEKNDECKIWNRENCNSVVKRCC